MSYREPQAESPCRIYVNRHFVVEQCRDCAIPGYLIVSPLQEAMTLAQLDAGALHSLGPTLALATAALEEVIKPVKTYCAQFGEGHGRIHFHVFPRTTEITLAYLADRPGQGRIIRGPVLLDWARDRYRTTRPSQGVTETIEKLRHAFPDAA